MEHLPSGESDPLVRSRRTFSKRMLAINVGNIKIIENSARFEQNLKNIILSEQKIVKVFEQFFYFSALTKKVPFSRVRSTYSFYIQSRRILGRGVQNPRCPAAVTGTKAQDATVVIRS